VEPTVVSFQQSYILAPGSIERRSGIEHVRKLERCPSGIRTIPQEEADFVRMPPGIFNADFARAVG
jgi:hypothetical protein